MNFYIPCHKLFFINDLCRAALYLQHATHLLVSIGCTPKISCIFKSFFFAKRNYIFYYLWSMIKSLNFINQWIRAKNNWRKEKPQMNDKWCISCALFQWYVVKKHFLLYLKYFLINSINNMASKKVDVRKVSSA